VTAPTGPRRCALCHTEFDGWGHNPQPVLPSVEQRVCADCNQEYVIPMRMGLLNPPTDRLNTLRLAARDVPR